MSMKRKAGAGALATASPAQKKARKSGQISEDVTEKGLEFLDILRDSRDKSGRLVAARFEKLPDKKREPEWYEQVSMPLSLEIVQTKLENGEYPTMTTLESDLKRMVFNWKGVYDRASEPHKDAEKVRKIITLHMKDRQLNPQYEWDPEYISFPTPLPGDDMDDAENMDESMNVDTPIKEEKPRTRIVLRKPQQTATADSEEDVGERKQPPRLRLRAFRKSDAADAQEESPGEKAGSPPPRRGRIILRRSSVSATDTGKAKGASSEYKMPEEASEGFEGKSMTEAQEKILNEMADLEDDEGNSISGPFVNLPSRELKDYYSMIKHPLSIRGAQKLVRGIRGRDKPTGTTFLETWQEFDEEIAHIWDNARIYNEDDSDISMLAGKLEKYFKMRVEVARKAVPDPVAPKLKLQVTKTPEASTNTPVKSIESSRATTTQQSNGYGVDEDALRRQKELVANGVIGKRDSANPTVAIKSDTSGEALTNGTSQSNATMQPPSMTPRPQPSVVRPPPPPQPEEVKKPWDTWLRADRPDAYRWPYHTIKEILIISHPSLDLGSKAYRWSLYPWEKLNYASDTIPLRTETNRILLSPLLVKPTRERPVVYHHVTLNGVRLQPSSSAPRIPGGLANEEDNLYRPVYDIPLNPSDVNEIMVECYTCPSEVCETKDVLFDKHMVNIQPR